jgi:hypothetical protein
LFTFSAFTLIESGCTPELPETLIESGRQLAQLSPTLKVSTKGASILSAQSHFDLTSNEVLFYKVKILPQSLDYQIDLEDRGCHTPPIRIELAHQHQNISGVWRPYLATLPDGLSALANLTTGDWSLDLNTPNWTPLSPAKSLPASKDLIGHWAWWVSMSRGAERAQINSLQERSKLEELYQESSSALQADSESEGIDQLSAPCGMFSVSEQLSPVDRPLVIRHRLYRELDEGDSEDHEQRFAVWHSPLSDAQLVERVVEEINRSNIQFSLILGNLTSVDDEAALSNIREGLSSLDVPWMITPGPHDASFVSSGQWSALFGATDFAFDTRFARVGMLNTAMNQVNREQYALMKTWTSTRPLTWTSEARPPLTLLFTALSPLKGPEMSRALETQFEGVHFLTQIQKNGVFSLFTTGTSFQISHQEVNIQQVIVPPLHQSSAEGHPQWLEVILSARCELSLVDQMTFVTEDERGCMTLLLHKEGPSTPN